jgi:hypothetical protein
MKTLVLRPGGRWQLNDRQQLCVLEVQGERVMLGLPSSVPLAGTASDPRLQPVAPTVSPRRSLARNPGYFWFQKGGARMFVAQARANQPISIDDDTSVVVLEVRPDCVRIGFIDRASEPKSHFPTPKWVD